MDEVIIRQYSPGDEKAVVDLWKACNLTKPWNNPELDINRKLEDSPELFLVGTIDGIIVASVHGGYARPQEFTGAIQKMIRERKLHEEYKKPILATWVGGKDFEDLVWDLKSAGVPIYPSSWRLARSMMALYLEGQRLKREKN